MKKTIQLTESELVNLIQKIVTESTYSNDLTGLKVKEIKRTGEYEGTVKLGSDSGIVDLEFSHEKKGNQPLTVKYFDNRVKIGHTYRAPLPRNINVELGDRFKVLYKCGADYNGKCIKA